MFARFFQSYDKFTTLALLPLLAIPFLLDKLFSLQPPWPTGSTYITAFIQLAIVFVGFFADIRSRSALRKAQGRLILISISLFLSYFLLYSLFVFIEPGSGRAIIAGFQCTADAAKYVAPLLGMECPFLGSEALSAASYKADVVWTPFSIKIMEFTIFVTWSLFFMIMSYLFSITIAFMTRKRLISDRQ